MQGWQRRPIDETSMKKAQKYNRRHHDHWVVGGVVVDRTTTKWFVEFFCDDRPKPTISRCIKENIKPV